MIKKIFAWLFQKQTLAKLMSEELYHLFVTAIFVFVAIKLKEMPSNDISWVTVILLILLFLILNIIVRAFYFWEKENKKELLREIDVEFKTNQFEEDIAYEISLEEAKKAKERIVIVADYSPPFEPLLPTEERQRYYMEIEKKLLEKKDVGFTYTRIMQRDKTNFENLSAKRGVIDNYEWIKGDEQAFAHCKRVLEIAKTNKRLKIKIIVSRNIPSIPSILLVDNKKMLFTIPKRVKGPDVRTAGVLNFTDNTDNGSAIVEKFINIVQTINEETNETLMITEIGNFAETEFQKWFDNQAV